MSKKLEINKNKYLFFTLVFFIFFMFNNINSIENKIILKVNERIITSIDLSNEIKILKLLNVNIKDLSREEVMEIAIKSLKKQMFKEIELMKIKKNLKVPDDYLNSYINNYSKKLNFKSNNEFYKYCEINLIDIEAVKKKITIELLWNQLIYQKFSKNVKIDKKKIEENILKKEFINEYLLYEIVFDIKNKENLKNKYDIIKRSIDDKGFEKTALTFSISDTSQNGGKLGRINETSLSPYIRKIIKKTNLNEYTKPIQIPGGFLILYIKDIKKVKNNLDVSKEIENAIKIRTNKQLDQFSNIYLKKIKKNLIINEY